MSAKNSGGGKANRRAKDAAMAADLKKRNVVRSTMRCPVCNAITGVEGKFTQHLAQHGGV